MSLKHRGDMTSTTKETFVTFIFRRDSVKVFDIYLKIGVVKLSNRILELVSYTYAFRMIDI